VRLTSALVMIFGALMVGLTTVTINGADITAVPPLGSKPGSSRPRIAFVDRLKGIAITSTCKIRREERSDATASFLPHKSD